MKQQTFEEFYEAYQASDNGILFSGREYSFDSIDFINNKARTLNYYKTEKLIPERSKKSHFSFMDLLWLRIVFQLRQLGVSYDLIRKLKDFVFAPIDPEEYAQILRDNEAIIYKTMDDFYSIIPEDLRGKVKDQMEKAYQEGKLGRDLVQNKFMAFLTYLIEYRVPGEIRLYADGTAEFVTVGLETVPQFQFINRTYVSVSVTEILSFYFTKDYIQGALLNTYFTKDEVFILETLRKQKCKSITIKYKDQHVDLIEIEKQLSLDKAQRLSEIFMANAYEEVTMKTQDGKILHCKKVTKIKPPHLK